jgi:hypothetical protein
VPIAAQPTNEAGATFVADYAADQPGVYRIKATSESGGEAVDTEAMFIVKDQSPELGSVDLNEPMLRELAESTGGAYVHLAEYETLIDKVHPGKSAVFRESKKSLWDTPWLLGGILVALTAEWLMRRLGGLA